MRVFIRVQVASILGSAADYAATILLTEIFRSPYLVSNFLGNILGGTVQFNLCRHWAFRNLEGKMPIQAVRFVLAFAGNLVLSAAGVYLMTRFAGFNYIISKTITSIALGLTYNYWVQKKFVFA
ncbi:MAG TPA: GtrA family protein [Puia sp.]|jgi:putative flippase GtrA|nr:GtrA family protein [Puia sp.]